MKTIEDLKMEFNQEIQILKRTQAQMKMERSIQEMGDIMKKQTKFKRHT